jgi:hypothetical protein
MSAHHQHLDDTVMKVCWMMNQVGVGDETSVLLHIDHVMYDQVIVMLVLPLLLGAIEKITMQIKIHMDLKTI